MPNPRQAVRSRLTRREKIQVKLTEISLSLHKRYSDNFVMSIFYKTRMQLTTFPSRLEDIRNSLTMLIPMVNDQSRTVMRRLVEIITEVVENIERITLERENSSNLLVNIHQGFRGRPKLEVSEEQIPFLREFSFSWRQISIFLVFRGVYFFEEEEN